MRVPAALRVLVWAFLVLGLAALVRAGVAPIVSVLPLAAAPSRPSTPTTTESSHNLNAAAALVVSRDLFRRSRGPSTITGTPSAPVSQPGAPKPVLTLVGLVVGAHPSAVIEGFPGIEGPRVVRAGDVIGQLTVRRIDHAGVELTGMNTTWVLTVRKPWD